ncbi:MAG: hypothetical protein F6K26_09595 [Moorea sp. SIO2I5]|nr:hypothetical protein [Moorena sp. SIO2I5]
MHEKKFYFPLFSGLIAGLIFGIQLTLFIQIILENYSARACAKIPDGKFAVFVPTSYLLNKINLKRVVISNKWAYNYNCKLFKSKHDYIKNSQVIKSDSFIKDNYARAGYIQVPSERYMLRKVWRGTLIGYFSEYEANLVRNKVLESAYSKEPKPIDKPFVVNNINTNN